MPRVSRCSVFIVVAALLSLGSLAPARAAGILEKNFWLSGPRYSDVLPPCEAALGKIADGFAEKESRFWNSALQIVDFTRVRQLAFHPWAASTIPRRFCAATAVVSDGGRPVRHTVYYSIGEDTGFLGSDWGVEWCVVGLDRNWAYNPACKMARP